MSYTPTITKSPLIWEGDTSGVIDEDYFFQIGDGFYLDIGSGFKLIVQPGAAGNNWTQITKQAAITGTGGAVNVDQDFYLEIGDGFDLLIGGGFKLVVQPGRAGNIWNTTGKQPAIF